MPFKPYILVGLLAMIMAGGLAYGFAAGEFTAEGGALIRMPWGLVTLIEVYVGLGLLFSWVFYRERSKPRALVWLVAALALGNIVACLYVLLAAYRAGGDPSVFFMGHRALEVRNG